MSPVHIKFFLILIFLIFHFGLNCHFSELSLDCDRKRRLSVARKKTIHWNFDLSVNFYDLTFLFSSISEFLLFLEVFHLVTNYIYLFL